MTDVNVGEVTFRTRPPSKGRNLEWWPCVLEERGKADFRKIERCYTRGAERTNTRVLEVVETQFQKM